MPMYECHCTTCLYEFPASLYKFDEPPTVNEAVKCEECHQFTKFRSINTIGRINIGGIEYGGDASRVRRFEMISKGVEEVDYAESAKQKRVVLKDSK